ncbi:MAG: capsular polysaccharide biosynthesis protein [Ruminococcus sp.]|uniref:CpsB/CapC family capsule biosynthesis tyrosine phosphatase n=1 Tax=Ruminococcus sp. TaxID=41978 RepID=UPI001B233D15|nr:CpsB/CapC family capsule biosynthesis tyrosine phosphatase [Ruminococcus sp.]MBO7475239.1 capsular polysaccharide biosynthesis protein [Ruminococcus sp.]
MLTEYHCHVLPGLDDGSQNLGTSLAMLEMMKDQGVKRVVFTPHFYYHKEESVDSFLERRQAAFEILKERSPIKNMLLGAEVAVENGISDVKDIEKLAIEGTSIMLMELPYRKYEQWMSEEMYNISVEYGIDIMLAHVHRYVDYCTEDEIESLINSNAIMQVNNDAFSHIKEKKLAKRIIDECDSFVFGSDAHNIDDRMPNWDVLKRKVGESELEISDGIIEAYSCLYQR